MVTGSALDRLEACPDSTRLPQVRSSSVYAGQGKAVHRYLEQLGQGVDQDEAMLDAPEDVRPFLAALRLEELPVDPKRFQPEVALAYNPITDQARVLGSGIARRYGDHGLQPGMEIPGTVDVVGLGEDVVYVPDFKTGHTTRSHPDAGLQLGFYGLAAARAYGKPRAVIEVIHLAEDEDPWRSAVVLDRLALAAMAKRVRSVWLRVQAGGEGPPTVTPGDHCQWCPAWRSCPAHAGMLQPYVAAGTPKLADGQVEALTHDQVAELWPKLQAAKKLIAAVDDACKRYVAREGPVPLGGGMELRAQDQPRRSVDGAAVWAVLEGELDPDQVREAVELTSSVRRLEDVLRRWAPARREELMRKLELEGAITTTTSTQVRARKAVPR